MLALNIREAPFAERHPLQMLALTLTLLGYTLRAPIGPACAARCAAARCDADRCYYGRVDADGNVLKGVAEVDIGPSVRPSLSLSPSEVVEAQFKALSRGRVGQNREGVAGIDSALEFVAPNIVEQHGTVLKAWRLKPRPAGSPGGFNQRRIMSCPRLPQASANSRPISRSGGSGLATHVFRAQVRDRPSEVPADPGGPRIRRPPRVWGDAGA